MEPVLRNYSTMPEVQLRYDGEPRSGRQPDPIDELCKKISLGVSRREEVLVQLNRLQKSGNTGLLHSYPRDDLSPLQLAAFWYDDTEVLKRIARLHPPLVEEKREGKFEGQTVLHIVIIRENLEAARFLLNRANSLLHVGATGPGFASTVMMGELPLSVAALTFNPDMVKLLLNKKAKPESRNSKGDTVFHSLVRYAALHPDKLQDARQMMITLHQELEERMEQTLTEQPRDIWLIENNEGLTALGLSASLAQPELFKLILSLNGVYRNLMRTDGLFDSIFYDITEVDPLALRQWRSCDKKSKCGQLATQNLRRRLSVLELVCETMPEKSYGLPPLREKGSLGVLNTDVVQEVIRLKWKAYRPWFWGWAVLHFLFMVLLSVYAVYRSRMIRVSPQPNSAERNFVIAMSIFSLCAPFVVWPLELRMRFRRKQPWRIKLLHHNGVYRMILLLFTLCLFADGIWFLLPVVTRNYIVVVALLLGWWFMTFFLRPFRKFSFFTVMLHRIFIGDLLRFCIVMFLVWLSFSLAMHTIYLADSDTEVPETFRDLWMSMLTMFQLLVGMAGTEEALPGWDKNAFAVVLYVLYVLVSFVLMLNSLIAMMASTFSTVYESRDRYWELQRLSVVLMLENLLPFQYLLHRCGKKEPKDRGEPEDHKESKDRTIFEKLMMPRYVFDENRQFQETRFFLQVTSAHISKPRRKEASGEETQNAVTTDGQPSNTGQIVSDSDAPDHGLDNHDRGSDKPDIGSDEHDSQGNEPLPDSPDSASNQPEQSCKRVTSQRGRSKDDPQFALLSAFAKQKLRLEATVTSEAYDNDYERRQTRENRQSVASDATYGTIDYMDGRASRTHPNDRNKRPQVKCEKKFGKDQRTSPTDDEPETETTASTSLHSLTSSLSQHSGVGVEMGPGRAASDANTDSDKMPAMSTTL